jgi:SNF2 family DNA or RNA helicase
MNTNDTGHFDIRACYDWPGDAVTPMEHQIETAAFLVEHKRALCLNAPGTGKTLSALWAADFLMEQGLIEKVLVVAPLSTLVPVWRNELVRHFPQHPVVVLIGTQERRKNILRKSDHKFALINHDGFTLLNEEFADYGLIIYDEATAIKSPYSKRFHTLYRHANKYMPRIWLMTGTPISQHPTNSWTLARIVDSPNVPSSYSRYKEVVMRYEYQYGNTYRWVPAPAAAEICKYVLQPSICYSLDQCLDLPEMSYINRECWLSDEQRQLFREMCNTAIISRCEISAANPALIHAKLLQICCGAAYDKHGEVVKFDVEDRLDSLHELIEEVGDKVIVYVPFRGVQELLEGELAKRGFDVASVHGDVPLRTRDQIFNAFQNTERYQVLLAHPGVASHGLTLTRSRDVIWYAPIYSFEQYEQANARIRRISTRDKTRVFNISATAFEGGLYRRLRERKLLLDDLLELLRKEISVPMGR